MADNIGEVVQGEVVRIRTYGAFVKLETGETGLVHISEIAAEFVRSVSDYLFEGEEVTVKVLGRNEENKLNLSIKQVLPQDVETIRYEQEIAAVQRDLSEREKRLPQFKVHQTVAEVERPFYQWIKDAEASLKRLERKRIKPKQVEGRNRSRRQTRRRPR